MTWKDIFGWFPPENVQILERLIQEHNIESVIEIGSFLGKSTAFFAERTNKVTVFDTFDVSKWPEGMDNGDSKNRGSFFSEFETNMKECGVWDKIRPNIMSSREGAIHYNGTADLVYIDGGHDYHSVVEDLVLWRDRAKKIICGDDYDSNWTGLMYAVDEFLPNRIVEGRIWYSIV